MKRAKRRVYKKYGEDDRRLMADWALDCAERVLHFFETSRAHDDRPRRAIETGRAWVRVGVFRMSDIRGASLAAHAAAREMKEEHAARFAARAAGQAVAAAHVPQHAYGAAYYALKAIAAADPAHAEAKLAEERDWQSRRLPRHLTREIMKRIVILKNNRGILVHIRKDGDF